MSFRHFWTCVFSISRGVFRKLFCKSNFSVTFFKNCVRKVVDKIGLERYTTIKQLLKNCVRKVGGEMTKLEIAQKVLNSTGGIAKTADFIEAGLAKYDVCNLNNNGHLERIRHGFYKLANNFDITDEQILDALLPEGIVCVESALFYYGYSDFTPRIWTLAVPRTISRAKIKIDDMAIKVYYIPNHYYELGKTSADFGETILSIYDRERTICDCFKYRTKLDNELFNKAINAYVVDEQKNLSNLSKYAKEMGLFKRVNDLMEVMLNG